MMFIIGLIVGFVIGFAFIILGYIGMYAGDFLIDQNDPERDIYRFVMKMDSERLKKCRYILLRIHSDACLNDSQEKQSL